MLLVIRSVNVPISQLAHSPILPESLAPAWSTFSSPFDLRREAPMQADDDFNEDTLARAKKELRKSEEGLIRTQEIVAQARHVASTIRDERSTNHWAQAIYRAWSGQTD